MDVDQAVEICRGAVVLTLLVAAPPLLVAVAVGLFVNILQAVTQLQDQTLSFVPKIAIMLLALLFVLPWMMTRMIDYSVDLIREIPSLL